MVTIAATVADEMIAHAIRGLPDEACGLVAGSPGADHVERFYPLRNAAASSRLYRIDGREMIEVERRVDAEGLSVVGVMHSHTHTTNYPSPTDVADAAGFDPFGTWLFWIVSLRHADPSLRCYRIRDDTITELPVDLVGGRA